MRRCCVWFLAVAVLCTALPAGAQTPPQQEIRAVIDRLFDGMRRGDSTTVRSLFHPEARLQSVSLQPEGPLVRTDSVDAFVRAVGSPHDEVWDERIANVEIRVDGNLAAAWMDYGFFLGSRFSHCGVDAFQLVRNPAGWQILQLADTRRRTGCERFTQAPA